MRRCDLIEKHTMLRVIEDLLFTKFGDEGLRLMQYVIYLNDGNKYLAVLRAIVMMANCADVLKVCVMAWDPERSWDAEYVPTNWNITSVASKDEYRKACIKAAAARRRKNGDRKRGGPKPWRGRSVKNRGARSGPAS